MAMCSCCALNNISKTFSKEGEEEEAPAMTASPRMLFASFVSGARLCYEIVSRNGVLAVLLVTIRAQVVQFGD